MDLSSSSQIIGFGKSRQSPAAHGARNNDKARIEQFL
jgi:hypothetical protein